MGYFPKFARSGFLDRWIIIWMAVIFKMINTHFDGFCTCFCDLSLSLSSVSICLEK